MNPGCSKPSLVAVDWGTSRLRAHLLGAAGRILESRHCDRGMATVTDGDFEAVLRKQCGDWIRAYPDVPIAMAGMVGSRNGWREAPYVPCPAGWEEVRANLLRFRLRDGASVAIVPGLTARSPEGDLDVIRGEETQILGTGVEDGVIVLPGTHSKWAVVDKRRVIGFWTFMTGELWGLLKTHSILRLFDTPNGSVAEEAANRAFRAGLAASAGTGGLLHRIFMARTGVLDGRLIGPDVASFLSGLLIGAEATAALALVPADLPVILVADGDLAQCYERVLRANGVSPAVVESQKCFLNGLRGLFLES